MEKKTMLCDWDGFCNKYKVLLNGVRLFKLEDGSVANHDYGRNKRKVLLRSDEMKTLVLKQAELVIRDSINKYCGLIYIMYRKKDSQVIPLYIGKCAKLGRTKVLNTNLKNISRNEQYFCRWGNDYYRHIGGLSAATLCGYSRKEPKYEDWAEELFEGKRPTNSPKEREPTYFWILACDTELLKEHDAKSLSDFESKLIVCTNEKYPTLLNVRKSKKIYK
ncbi:MAG: hypothetical protein WA130_03730 [Candidatus Methanoperedens sp.]